MLREATPEDIGAIQRVRGAVRENRLVSRTIPDTEVNDAITQRGKGWVIELDGVIVAFGIADATARCIWALFVDPEHEGQGHGRRVHDTMVNWLFERGESPIWLSTDPGTRAQGFYEAAGWIATGRTAEGELRFERSTPVDTPKAS